MPINRCRTTLRLARQKARDDGALDKVPVLVVDDVLVRVKLEGQLGTQWDDGLEVVFIAIDGRGEATG